jgi:hypothetical protein
MSLKKNIESNKLLVIKQTFLFDKINWVEGDITDIPSLNKAFESILVYHCSRFNFI